MNHILHEGYQSPYWTCVRLDNDVMRRLQSDDDDIADRIEGLEVSENEWIQGAGCAIANSKHLKSLHVSFSTMRGAGWFFELSHGLSHNKTIEKLSVEHLCEGKGSVVNCVDILFPFFVHNDNLRCLEVRNVYAWELNSLLKLLSKCKTRLEFLKIDFPHMSDSGEKLEMFFNSLNEMHTSLLELCFNYTIHGLEMRGCVALANLLVNPACKIRLVQFDVQCLNEGSAVIRDALIKNTSVKSLYSKNFLRHSDHCAIVAHPMCSVEKLWLVGCSYDPESLTSLGEALAFNKSVKHLYIDGGFNMSFMFGSAAWQGISVCFSTNLVLETLDVDNIDEDGVMVIIRALALANNISVRKFIIGDEIINSSVREAISRVLCDKSSIDSTFSSCHSLHTIAYRQFDIQDDCEYYLQMNVNDDRAEVARRKIIEEHFGEAKMDANVQMFARLPVSMLPTAVGWIGRDRLGYSLMFRFVQSTPALVAYLPEPGVKRRKLLS
jgi:hypothetical protein